MQIPAQWIPAFVNTEVFIDNCCWAWVREILGHDLNSYIWIQWKRCLVLHCKLQGLAMLQVACTWLCLGTGWEGLRMWGCNSDSFDIPKSTTLVLLPAIRSTVAWEVQMDDVIQVEIGKDQGYAIAQIDLKMVGKGLIWLLEIMSEGFIQQFNQ